MHIAHALTIPVDDSFIQGDLTLVPQAHGIIIFAHGSGSSRLSSRNKFVAELLNNANFSTLLFDLLTSEEDHVDAYTAEFRFNISLLTERLITVTQWIKNNHDTAHLSIGYFGASTGAAAALMAAAQINIPIAAIVSRGGRPDLAGNFLQKVTTPTLLIVGERDYEVIFLNESAYNHLACEKKLILIPEATHLFEEPGALKAAADCASEWFKKYVV